VEVCRPTVWDFSVIFFNPKENSHPTRENSPNLVTLHDSDAWSKLAAGPIEISMAGPERPVLEQGCQMVYFRTKNPIYFTAILVTLWSFGTFPPGLVYYTEKNLATLFSNLAHNLDLLMFLQSAPTT
jgi:hypothetical protein